MVGSYLELLSRRYEDKLDNEAHEFIGFAVDGATRMKRLINDLLGYSRAGSNPLKLETVDVGDLLQSVRVTLALHIEETHADVHVGPMPSVTADALQLSRVFQNLIENAPEVPLGRAAAHPHHGRARRRRLALFPSPTTASASIRASTSRSSRSSSACTGATNIPAPASASPSPSW